MSTEQELLRRLQAALRGADVDAASLVEEAWEAARTEVRDVLRRTMTHDLLRRTLEHLEPSERAGPGERIGPEPPPSPDPPVPPVPSDPPVPPDPTDATVVYVFGIGRSRMGEIDGGLPHLPGGGPVRGVDRRGLRALVCDLEVGVVEELQDPSPSAFDTLATAATVHDTVLASIASRAPVVPFRLGTVVDDDAAMTEVLDRHAAALDAELDRFDGRTEWAVTVQLLGSAPSDGGTAEADGVRAGPGPHTTTEPGRPDHGREGVGASYLRQRSADVSARRTRIDARARITDDIHGRLSALADDADTIERRDRDGVPPRHLHGVYLLANGHVEAFHRTVDALRVDHPAAIIEASGPWPPYHFTAVRLDDSGGVPADPRDEAP